VPALREILKRSGILDGGPNIALPGDDPQSAVVSPNQLAIVSLGLIAQGSGLVLFYGR
jgi:hypothetical protein